MTRTGLQKNASKHVQAGASSHRSASHGRRSATRTSGSQVLTRKFLRAVKLSQRQLRAAYPYVAFLLQALSTSPSRASGRPTNRSLSHPAQA